MKCPNCHTENSVYMLFCTKCGEFLNPNDSDFTTASLYDDTVSKKFDPFEFEEEEIERQLNIIGDVQKKEKKKPPKPKKEELVKIDISEEELKQKNQEEIDDGDNFENTKHNLKIFMVGLAIFFVIFGISIGVFSIISDQTQINKNSLSHYSTLLNQAKSLENVKEYDLAISTYMDAIEVNPTLSAAYYGLSRVYSIIGEHEKSQFILEQGYINTGDALLLNG